MEIPEKYFWPLVGVLLGWLLSALSSGWKSRAERLKFLGRLLTRLLDVHGDLKTLISTSENVKDIAGGWEQYEPLRQRIYRVHFLDSSIKANDVTDLISNLAGYLPLEAAKLQKLSHTLLKSRDLKLDASAKDSKTYVRLLSMHEVALIQCEKELRRIVHAIAWKHGAITRLKLWLHQRKINKSLPKNAAFLEAFSKETMDGIGKGA
jgi:hypothetical protein